MLRWAYVKVCDIDSRQWITSYLTGRKPNTEQAWRGYTWRHFEIGNMTIGASLCKG